MDTVDVIVVADGEQAELAWLSDPLPVPGLSVVATAAGDAPGALAPRAAPRGGCCGVGVGDAAAAALEATAEHGSILGFVSLDGGLDRRHAALLAQWAGLAGRGGDRRCGAPD